MAKSEVNNKFYQVKKTIGVKEYIAQFSGISMSMKAVDSCYIENSRNISSEKMTQYILDNVIVEPKGLKIDDFDSLEELQEVTEFGQKVMGGSLRSEAI